MTFDKNAYQREYNRRRRSADPERERIYNRLRYRNLTREQHEARLEYARKYYREHKAKKE